jgi:methyltransferase-like protein/2-polyprenyl-3-methyl-5-hydroxy-6-metoxy-1,4-benzoquinol methylase
VPTRLRLFDVNQLNPIKDWEWNCVIVSTGNTTTLARDDPGSDAVSLRLYGVDTRMRDSSVNPYDEVLYNNCAALHTHPNRLAVMASLFGLAPAPVERCRVLELGCGNGANVIPMAYTFPESRFLGIDLAGRPIATGQAMIRELGLKNITLEQMDILDFPKTAGEFDYIITYGIYSWVPEAVRGKILEISKAHLAPQGVAFVSYNTFPGWRLRQMMREMMQYHTASCSNPQQTIQQARALVQFLAGSSDTASSYGRFLAEELRGVVERPGSGLYHDDLASINDPVYFFQFAEHAAKHGLQFLTETQFIVNQEINAPPEMRETLSRLATDVVQREQYLDFLECRRFRQTLLCHDHASVNRDLSLDIMKSFRYVSLSRLESPDMDLSPGKVVKFGGPRDATMATAHPLAKAALQHLSENWPAPFTIAQVTSAALERIAGAGLAFDSSLESAGEEMCQLLLTAYGAGLVEALTRLPSFALTASERPVASPIARLQLTLGDTVTSLLHTTLEIADPLARRLVMLLDGTRDRSALAEGLSPLIDSGEATVKIDNQPVTDKAAARRVMVDQLEEALNNIARIPLLIG